MKTVSTKLENRIHDKFLELCNNEGKCQSEFLRDMIETLCEDCSDDNEPLAHTDLEVEDVKPEPVTNEPAVMAHGKIYDDDGNLVGTF